MSKNLVLPQQPLMKSRKGKNKATGSYPLFNLNLVAESPVSVENIQVVPEQDTIQDQLKRQSYIMKRLDDYEACLLEIKTMLVTQQHAEVLELNGNAARDNKKSRMIPRHVLLVVENDEELEKLLARVTISNGGVLPNINSILLHKKSEEASKSPKKD
ncbi:uncharacterized protein LOC131218063 [Magnolia sinica]|uniref:uncharacterized protein LOC131218063 n=1 Tax=Magnolia sinica TaxID=86752 RepID=UPI0026590480|nr:uncharacterized protein LOC131218063 [Magnolia sinica]